MLSVTAKQVGAIGSSYFLAQTDNKDSETILTVQLITVNAANMMVDRCAIRVARDCDQSEYLLAGCLLWHLALGP